MKADAEIESVKRVRYGLTIAIPAAFSKGYSDADKECKNEMAEANSIGKNLSSRLARIQVAIDRKRRDLEQAAQQRQQCEKEVERLKALQKKGDALLQTYRTSVKKTFERMDIFLAEFKKYSTNGGGSGDSDPAAMGHSLGRMIENLDRYVHTNFSSAAAASYNSFVQQMNQQQQSFAQQVAIQNAQRASDRERTLGDE